MKVLVKPTGPHCYMDPMTSNLVEPFRPSVVMSSTYITGLLGSGKLALIAGNLLEDATDEEFAKFYAESERKESLAVESFLSKFSLEWKPAEDPVQITEEPAPVITQAGADKEAAEKTEVAAKVKAEKATEKAKD